MLFRSRGRGRYTDRDISVPICCRGARARDHGPLCLSSSSGTGHRGSPNAPCARVFVGVLLPCEPPPIESREGVCAGHSIRRRRDAVTRFSLTSSHEGIRFGAKSVARQVAHLGANFHNAPEPDICGRTGRRQPSANSDPPLMEGPACERITRGNGSAPARRICSKRSSRRNGAAAGSAPGSARASQAKAMSQCGRQGRRFRRSAA